MRSTKSTVPRTARSSAQDLPVNIKARFTTAFCPLWRDYLGTITNPWDTDNNAIDDEMQACFDIACPDSGWGKIKKGDTVHNVVSEYAFSNLCKKLLMVHLGHATLLRVAVQIFAESRICPCSFLRHPGT